MKYILQHFHISRWLGPIVLYILINKLKTEMQFKWVPLCWMPLCSSLKLQSPMVHSLGIHKSECKDRLNILSSVHFVFCHCNFLDSNWKTNISHFSAFFLSCIRTKTHHTCFCPWSLFITCISTGSRKQTSGLPLWSGQGTVEWYETTTATKNGITFKCFYAAERLTG